MMMGEKPLVMGILNVTPDSFSDGGAYVDPGAALDQAMKMVEEGADLIDIGGESTRPGSEGISTECELQRIVPIMRLFGDKVRVPISIDTTKAAVARAAVDLGAEIVNDISALRQDEAMAAVVAETKAAVVLMHMRGLPKTMQQGNLDYDDVIADIFGFLESRIAAAMAAGISPDRIVTDPGIGFGKTADDNIRIMKDLRTFRALGYPLLIGASRKGFIGHVTGEPTPAARLGGTAATVAAAVMNGADIVRVHDVGLMRSVADMAWVLRK